MEPDKTSFEQGASMACGCVVASICIGIIVVMMPILLICVWVMANRTGGQ